MDYLKQMSDTGVIDFDEVDDRIDDMKEKQKEQEEQRQHVTLDQPAAPDEEDGQSPSPDHDLTDELNEALRKVQDNHNRELNRLQKAHDHLKEHLKELRHEIERLQNDHEKTRSQVKRLSDPPAQAPANHPSQGKQQKPAHQPRPQGNNGEEKRSQQPNNQEPNSRGQADSNDNADPKTSDYSSDDVALNKVFDTDKTL